MGPCPQGFIAVALTSNINNETKTICEDILAADARITTPHAAKQFKRNSTVLCVTGHASISAQWSKMSSSSAAHPPDCPPINAMSACPSQLH